MESGFGLKENDYIFVKFGGVSVGSPQWIYDWKFNFRVNSDDKVLQSGPSDTHSICDLTDTHLVSSCSVFFTFWSLCGWLGHIQQKQKKMMQ